MKKILRCPQLDYYKISLNISGLYTVFDLSEQCIACDTTNHFLLLDTLHALGILISILGWFPSFLSAYTFKSSLQEKIFLCSSSGYQGVWGIWFWSTVTLPYMLPHILVILSNFWYFLYHVYWSISNCGSGPISDPKRFLLCPVASPLPCCTFCLKTLLDHLKDML